MTYWKELFLPKSLLVILKSLLFRKIVSLKQIDSRLAAFKFGSNDRKDVPLQLGSAFPSSEIHGTAERKYTLLRMEI